MVSGFKGWMRITYAGSINVIMITSSKVRRRHCLDHLLFVFVQGLIKKHILTAG